MLYRVFFIVLIFCLSARADNPPEITFSPPSIIEAVEGDSIRLSCGAEGRGDLTFRWFRGGKEIDSGSTIVIKHLRKVHEGNYVCIVENQYGSDTTGNCRIIVKGAARVKVAPSAETEKIISRKKKSPEIINQKPEKILNTVFFLPRVFLGEHLGGDSLQLAIQISPQSADSLHIWYGSSPLPDFSDTIYSRRLDPGFFYSDSDTIFLTLHDNISKPGDTIYAALVLSAGRQFSDTLFTSFTSNRKIPGDIEENCKYPSIRDAKMLEDSLELCVYLERCESNREDVLLLCESSDKVNPKLFFSIPAGEDSVRLKLALFTPGEVYDVLLVPGGDQYITSEKRLTGLFTIKIPERLGNTATEDSISMKPGVSRISFNGDSVIFKITMSYTGLERVVYTILDSEGKTVWNRPVVCTGEEIDSLVWDGFSDYYSQVPAGFYIFRIKAIFNSNSEEAVGYRQFWYNPSRGNI